MEIQARTVCDRFFPSIRASSLTDTCCNRVSHLCLRAFNWLADQFPQACAKLLPTFLAPTESIPWIDVNHDREFYAFAPEEQKELQAYAQQEEWNGFGVIRYNDQYVVKGPTGSHQTYLRRTGTLCGVLRWEGDRACSQRAPMARRMRAAIEKWDLDRLYIPIKKIANLVLEGWARDVVVCERLELMTEQEARAHFISLQEKEKMTILRQLFTLCSKSACSDLKFGENITFVKSGLRKDKLAIIDTEPFGIDSLLKGRLYPSSWYEPSTRMYQEEARSSRNVYLIGGERNAEIAIGSEIAQKFLREEMSFLSKEDQSICRRAFFNVSFESSCEYTANFIKTWALRLLLPTAALISTAIAARFTF